MDVVKISGLVKDFGKFRALDGVDLTVKQGEVYGFIGPNGAGKTTTIRVLLGILRASAGSAQIFGRDAWSDAVDIHRQIAYVPGDVSLWQNLTGGEVIDLLIKLRNGKKGINKEELIKRFDLDPTKKCRSYSKGNRQKVALIAAFASDADLFVLDEPTSGLDPLMESVFVECVSMVKERGKSVLLSSHIMSEVEKLCDKVSIIRAGKIIETGTIDDLRHLTRLAITVRTEEAVANLERLAGVHDIVNDADALRMSVDADAIGSVIAHLSASKILTLECVPPTLEEMFMQHYEKEQA